MRPYFIAAILIFLGGISVLASMHGLQYINFADPDKPVPYIAGVILICSGCLCIVGGDLKAAIEQKNEEDE